MAVSSTGSGPPRLGTPSAPSARILQGPPAVEAAVQAAPIWEACASARITMGTRAAASPAAPA
eukprot:4019286-Pyramimonas_sp.AAC.1